MTNELERKAIEASRFDPLDTAKQMAEAGIISEGSRDGLAFLMMHENSAHRKMLWQELGDTYRNMPWEELVRIITADGFTTVYEWQFPYKYGSNDDSPIFYPRKLIAADVGRKMLLSAESWIQYGSLQETVSGVGVTCYIQAPDDAVGEIRSQVHGNSGYERDDTWEFGIYGEEGLLSKLKAFNRDDVKLVNWLDIPINLDDYSNIYEDRRHNRDYSPQARKKRDDIRLKKIGRFLRDAPAEIADFMDPTGEFRLK